MKTFAQLGQRKAAYVDPAMQCRPDLNKVCSRVINQSCSEQNAGSAAVAQPSCDRPLNQEYSE